MLIVPDPEREAERAKILEDLKILDSPPDKYLDDLTELAAHICRTPIALITLIDRDRQWFKSRVGLEMRQTPRDLAFCVHAIAGADDVFIVPDAQQDERFKDNPLVTLAPHIRFYAGAPLVTAEGVALGSLCVIDRVPRRLTPEQLSALRALCRHVVSALEQQRALGRLAEADTRALLEADRRLVGVVAERLRAEAEAANSQHYLEVLVDSINGIVHELDAETFRFVFVSPRAERLLGHPLAEWFDEPNVWVRSLHPEDRERTLAHCTAEARARRDYSFEYRILTKDERVLWLRNVMTVAVYDGRPRLRGVMIDITEQKRTEESLRDSQRRLELAIEAADIHLWQFDLVTHTMTTDERWVKAMGYGANEIAPTFYGGWATLIHPEDLPHVEEALEAYVAGRVSGFQSEFRMRTKNGRWRWISTRSKAIAFSSSGKPLRIAGTGLDVTERKQGEEALRESEQRFRAAFEQAAVGIGHVSPDGRWMRINEKFAQMLGYRCEELIGRHWTEFSHPDDVVTCAKLVAGLIDHVQDSFQAEKRWLRKDGTALWAQTTASSVRDPDGAIRYFSVICVDLSERQRAEAERLAREAAESASRAKSEFLAHMSHELRSPLNTILGFAKLVQRSGLPKDVERDVGIIVRSGEHLLALINQVLSLSKIEAGRATLDRTRVDLPELLRDLREMFAQRAAEHGLEFVVEGTPEPRFVEADRTKLSQVLINLLSNAVKFTRSGRVSLELEADRRADAPAAARSWRLRFAVRDTGPGIADDELKRLFRPFVQAEAGRQAGEGSGLGLAISRNFVRLMGGELGIISRLGQGTTVSFEIPVQEAGEDAADRAERVRCALALAPGQPHWRLLVVDDLPEARELLVRLLQPLGFELKEAGNGLEAVAIADQWQPDFVWMDLAMPGLDGMEAARRIKAQAERPPVVVALTAHAFEEERPEILAAGCDDFLRKPLREDKLLSLLEKHLGARFVYADEAMPPPGPGIAALSALPAEARDELAGALSQLDSGAVDRWIQTLRTTDPRLADAVAELAEGFDYDRILSYLRSLPPRDSR